MFGKNGREGAIPEKSFGNIAIGPVQDPGKTEKRQRGRVFGRKKRTIGQKYAKDN